jgi:hypothetical protein
MFEVSVPHGNQSLTTASNSEPIKSGGIQLLADVSLVSLAPTTLRKSH